MRSVSMKILIIFTVMILPLNILTVFLAESMINTTVEHIRMTQQNIVDLHASNLEWKMEHATAMLHNFHTENADCLYMMRLKTSDYEYLASRAKLYAQLKEMRGMVDGADGYFFYFPLADDMVVCSEWYIGQEAAQKLKANVRAKRESEFGEYSGWYLFEYDGVQLAALMVHFKNISYGAWINLDKVEESVLNGLEYHDIRLEFSEEPTIPVEEKNAIMASASAKNLCMNSKKEYADKYGFEADDNKLYTLEQMEEMFAIVKEGEGDGFYMTTPWNNTYEPLNYSYQEYDPVTGSFSGGVLMLNRSFEDLTLYNYFETEEYKAYCEMMYDWAQKGYIAPDAAVDTDYSNRAADSNYLGTFGYGAPENEMLTTSASWGQDVVQFRIVDGFFKLNGGCTVNWNVPVTSANPAKAVQAIEYVLTHPEAATLIQYGFEGEEYEVVEETDGVQVIKLLAEDVNQLPYNNVYGLWGDRFKMAQVYPVSAEYGAKMIKYQNAIPDSRKSQALGYSFKQESVSAEIAAVETVMEQYCFSFNAGALDPDKALPEFISALKAAGIDDIIAENQRQLDEWAANR